MAKIKINKISKGIKSVKGLSTKDILKMDVYKLNKKSLKNVVNRLVSSANKRLRRLSKNAPSSPALRQHYDYETNTIKPFSLKGAKTRNDVERVMKQVKSFLQAETSTIKGYKKYQSEFKDKFGEFESKEQANEFWQTYNKWVDTHPELYNLQGDTNGLVEMFYDEFVVKGRTARGTSSKITRTLNKMHQVINQRQVEEDELIQNELKEENAFRIKKDF